MFYLLLAILCSSTIAIVFKISENNNMNRLVVTIVNYFIAFFICLFFIVGDNLCFNLEFSPNFWQILSNNEQLLNGDSFIWAVIIGIPAGVFFFLGFIYYQKSVRENGVGLAGTFSKLGILIPIIASLILWHEYPSLLQWIGIIMALTAIILVNFPFNKNLKKALNITLILLFIFGGIASFSNKLFQKYALQEYKVVFLFAVFFTAFIISLIFFLKKPGEIKAKEIYAGIAVGIPNLFTSFFLINALDALTTAVVFPIFSAGGIVVINLAGYLVFKEKLNKREFGAIVITVLALILINVK